MHAHPLPTTHNLIFEAKISHFLLERNNFYNIW